MFGGRGEAEYMMMQSLQAGVWIIGLLILTVMVILCFGKERIARPRVFNWGALLITGSLVMPMVVGIVVGVTQFTLAVNRGNVVGETIAGLLMGMLAILAPLGFALGLFLAMFGLTMPSGEILRRKKLRDAEVADEMANLPDQPIVAEPAQPHPLD